ncbi:MAG: MIP family channel protein [Candidatus Synechococcus spongiarum SP3]|uniref:MIP family channel protein n=1 Tax=Candidatus Synechococcus spongiarum SP3 TaxID=1604020 RepID=A0A0G2HKX1_9SYNE|nr:MAG: MIP family channel protein [Candidatus Synechococcus spongiarum SP3]
MKRALVAEVMGTALLLMAVVGSGIMGEQLADGNAGLALLANAVSTGAMLYGLITVLGPVSGGHFNPAVTLCFRLRKEITTRQGLLYGVAQVVGGILGVWATHVMFGLVVLQQSTTARTGGGQWFSEALATAGLLLVIHGGQRHQPSAVPALVALYITSAYWFSASTSFANPAVTIARGLTDTFSGILPAHVPMFVATQLLSAAVATPLLGWLFPSEE